MKKCPDAIVTVFMALVLALAAVALAQEKMPFTAEIGPDGVQRVEVTGGSYFFEPSHIIVKLNVPVELVVRKEKSVTPHNIAMNSPEAGMVFREELSTDPKTIKFTPTKTGKYPFYCEKKFLFFPSHRSQGMEGVIEVVK